MLSLLLSFLVSVALITVGLTRMRHRRSNMSRATLGPRAGRSPSGSESAPLVLDQLIESSKRMRTVTSTVLIRTMTANDAHRLMKAEMSAFIPSVPGRRRVFPSAGDHDFFVRSEIVAGELAEVLDAGTSFNGVLTADPALLNGPAAVAACPVRVRGEIAGAILVARSSTAPFAEVDSQMLRQLAAICGSALDAASPSEEAIAPIDVDELTRLHNRRRLDRDLGSLADDETVALGLVEIDGLSQINDRYGHAVGDETIVAVAGAISARIRSTDIVYRSLAGGFNVLMPGATAEQAMAAMLRVQHGLSEDGVITADGRAVTVSIGVASGCGEISLATGARAALKEAKRRGTSHIIAAPPVAAHHTKIC